MLGTVRVGTASFVSGIAAGTYRVKDIYPGLEQAIQGAVSIYPVGLPALGNQTFAVEIVAGAYNATCILAIDVQRKPFVLSGCTLYLPNIPLIIGTQIINSGVTIPLAVPHIPSLLGAEAFLQAAIDDKNGGWLGTMSLTNGLHLIVGQ